MNSTVTVNLKNPLEVRKAGLDALVIALGPVGMAMFLKQYEIGDGDYTKERGQYLNDLTEEDIAEMIINKRNK